MVSTTARVWLITGASAGLGLALTQAVLARGDYVIATARSLRSFDELREDPNIDRERLRFLVLDVTSPMAEIQERVDEALVLWGRIDVLVNNAGIVTFGISEELGSEGFMRDMNTNFVGAMNVTNAVLPHMRSRREGTVTFIGSRSAYRTMVGTSSYSASKAAVHAYAETLAIELEQFKVRVIITVPGGFATKFNAPTPWGTQLEGYEALHNGMEEMMPKYLQVPKSDPILGMKALVDVVRGEGRAASRGGSLPTWFFLGEDCMRDVRARAEKLLSTLEEWKDVGSNVGLPAAST
ncbi:hypothetical protein BJV74DRAFT_546031 [Russula compacta]|nr:hypothetical protein BJV74DRAFT_546031 [Russula compacta]